MRLQDPKTPNSIQYQEKSSPTTAELVILCSFGDHLAGRLSGAQLRKALTQAGFRAPEARHIMRTSMLLERHPADHYTLRASPRPSGKPGG
jgi:hypothetical protein